MRKEEYKEQLKKKAEQAERIFDLTSGHHDYIENDDVEQLERSLNSRQQCINAIQDIEKGLSDIKPETQGWEKDGEIVAMYEHINSLIRQSIEMDEKNCELGKGRMDHYKTKLKENRAARQGVGAYMTYTAAAGNFDQKR